MNEWGFGTIGLMVLYLFVKELFIPLYLSKKQFIHKLQFEKEFEIYKELWGELFVLQDLVKRYLLTPKTGPSGREIALSILGKSKAQHIRVESVIYQNKPFYDPEVYKNAREILAASLERQFPSARHFGRASRGEVASIEEISDDDLQSIDNEHKRINDIIEEVEKAIRKRIGSLNKSKLVV